MVGVFKSAHLVSFKRCQSLYHYLNGSCFKLLIVSDRAVFQIRSSTYIENGKPSALECSEHSQPQPYKL